MEMDYLEIWGTLTLRLLFYDADSHGQYPDECGNFQRIYHVRQHTDCAGQLCADLVALQKDCQTHPGADGPVRPHGQPGLDAKYTSGGKNEIGQLGEHFNRMSETLERTISQLKSANNQLQRDIEKKTKIDEMRKEFLSNVSHELKTPLALIQGYAEGLKECINDDAESRDFYCDVIMDEAGKMNELVKELLNLNELSLAAIRWKWSALTWCS